MVRNNRALAIAGMLNAPKTESLHLVEHVAAEALPDVVIELVVLLPQQCTCFVEPDRAFAIQEMFQKVVRQTLCPFVERNTKILFRGRLSFFLTRKDRYRSRNRGVGFRNGLGNGTLKSGYFAEEAVPSNNPEMFRGVLVLFRLTQDKTGLFR